MIPRSNELEREARREYNNSLAYTAKVRFNEARIKAGEYKSPDEYTLLEYTVGTDAELPHLTILTDEWLAKLLDKIQYGSPLTLKEIGDIMGLSRERARQIEQKALRKMKKNKIVRGLHE